MADQTPSVKAIDHLVLTVRNTSATVAFYEKLGMAHKTFKAADGTTRHALSFGAQKINLHQHGAEFDPKAAHPGPGTADLCFLTDTPLADWLDVLDVEEGPVPRSGATGPIMSIYLRDPDGNLIEISVPR